jgi:CheY-like chemotaxis protein
MVDDRSARRAQILLVEDDDDSREVLAEVLEEEGYGVVTAADGSIAIDLALSSSFDVAIVDIGLPRVDGYEVARRIRAAPHGPRIRLVALTGHSATSHPGASAAVAFDRFLMKPIDPQELLRALEEMTAETRGEESRSDDGVGSEEDAGPDHANAAPEPPIR